MDNKMNVSISPVVIKDIVNEVLNGIDGVYGLAENNENVIYKEVTKIFNKKDRKVEVEIGGSDCVIDIPVVLVYGYNIKNVMSEIKEKVTDAVKQIADINVKEINITVERLQKNKEKEEEHV